MTDSDISVTRADDRYEIRLGDTVAGYTLFRPDAEGRLVFPHTMVDPAYKGQGLGSILVGRALADVADRGETVVPVCPFVQRYLRGHDVPGLTVDWPTVAE